MVENIDIAKEIHAMSRMRFQSDFGFLNSVSYVKRYQSSICGLHSGSLCSLP